MEGRPDAGGPFLQAAFFCERVLQERDGVATAVRIVDRLNHVVSGVGTPAEMPPVPVNLTLLVILKSGAARGRHEVTIVMEEPSGLRKTVIGPLTVIMEGEERGANLVFQLQWQASQEGLYWFDVMLADARLTRVPLRLVYQRQETGQTLPG